jgi:hypothetical protein
MHLIPADGLSVREVKRDLPGTAYIADRTADENEPGIQISDRVVVIFNGLSVKDNTFSLRMQVKTV